MFYINDKVKKDFTADGDAFGGFEYVEKVMNALRVKDIKSIGIYGKWGIGKTSVIENTIKELIKSKDYCKKTIVNYNAWKYSGHDFMRDFLTECSKQIEGKESAEKRGELYYSDQNESSQINYLGSESVQSFLKQNQKMILGLMLGLISICGIVLYGNVHNPAWYNPADIITPLVLLFISLIFPILLVSKTLHKKTARKFSPEQFSSEFKKIVGNKSILIIIDDIDRCDRQEIKKTFDTLKTFILNEEGYNVKFIISVDPNILMGVWGENPYDYFTKIIDFPIEIKKYPRQKFEELEQDIIKNSKKKYQEIIKDGIYLASKFYVDTPRKMKKFANEFINQIYEYEPSKIKNKGAMFAKLIILKNEYPSFYNLLITNYEVTVKHTEAAIEIYEKDNIISSTYGEFEFDLRILEFLSKTSIIDLYDYQLYLSKICYEHYMIKRICENPIKKHGFDPNNRIDLKKSVKFIEYELNENIIIPLQNNKLIFNKVYDRICFLVTQFYSQVNNGVFDQFYHQIAINSEALSKDRYLTIDYYHGNEEIIWIRIPYVTEALQPWINVLNNNSRKVEEDALVNIVVKLAKELLEEVPSEQLISLSEAQNDFLKLFSTSTDINNEHLLEIISIYLDADFANNHSNIQWFFENSPNSLNHEYTENIVNLLKENTIQFDFTTYLEERYKQRPCHLYIDSIFKEIASIKSNPAQYEMALMPLANNIKPIDISFEKAINFVKSSGLASSNITFNTLILKVFELMPKTEDFNNDVYKSMLTKLGTVMNNFEVNEEFKRFISKRTHNEIYGIFELDEELEIFNNYALLKEYGAFIAPSKKTKKIFSYFCKTYKENNGVVFANQIENYGFNLREFEEAIMILIKDDASSYIYLSEYISPKNINELNLGKICFENLDLIEVRNHAIRKKIENKLKSELANNIKLMKLYKDDVPQLKGLLNKFILFTEKLYCDLGYSDKTFWEYLKEVDEYMSYSKLTDNVYLPKLRSSNRIITLFVSGKHRKSYQQDHMHADKVVKFMLQ